MQITKISVTLALIVSSAIIGIGIERFLLADRDTAGPSPADESALQHARKHLDPDYVCPMHAEVVAHRPR